MHALGAIVRFPSRPSLPNTRTHFYIGALCAGFARLTNALEANKKQRRRRRRSFGPPMSRKYVRVYCSSSTRAAVLNLPASRFISNRKCTSKIQLSCAQSVGWKYERAGVRHFLAESPDATVGIGRLRPPPPHGSEGELRWGSNWVCVCVRICMCMPENLQIHIHSLRSWCIYARACVVVNVRACARR